MSAAAVSSFIELEFIIQPFFSVMCPPEQDGEGGGGETERDREGGLATAQECVPIG